MIHEINKMDGYYESRLDSIITVNNGFPRYLCKQTKYAKADNDNILLQFMSNLLYLDCAFSKMTKIPVLDNLLYLNVSHTSIKSIPVLPNLRSLDCSYTYLKELPSEKGICLLINLEYLNYYKSDIKELPHFYNMKLLISSI